MTIAPVLYLRLRRLGSERFRSRTVAAHKTRSEGKDSVLAHTVARRAVRFGKHRFCLDTSRARWRYGTETQFAERMLCPGSPSLRVSTNSDGIRCEHENHPHDRSTETESTAEIRMIRDVNRMPFRCELASRVWFRGAQLDTGGRAATSPPLTSLQRLLYSAQQSGVVCGLVPCRDRRRGPLSLLGSR